MNEEPILPTPAEFILPGILYLLHLSVAGALNVLGVVLFSVNLRKVRVERPASALSAREKRRAAVLNVGMIAVGVVLIAFTVMSLFP